MARVVLDLGKTLSKLTLWSNDGQLIDRQTRPNEVQIDGGLRRLDAAGIEAWLLETLAAMAARDHIDTIIPVGHGAACAIVRDGAFVTPPVDYEADYPPELCQAYDALRSPFAQTGSPRLPFGLNLGMQIFALLDRDPTVLDGAQMLLWPQYWAWRLCGVATSEASSLGCHTDLWDPVNACLSPLGEKLGLGTALPPLRGAGDALGSITAEIAAQTGLPPTTIVHCGIHDSNAALIAARALPQIGNSESTVISTGTWFIAMRSPERASDVDISALPEARDCLVNVDAYGKPVPSARFMGGREIEQEIGIDTRRVDIREDQPLLLDAVDGVVAAGSMLLPTGAPGTGPYPDLIGAWVNKPVDWYARRAAVCLYAALIADRSLDLIGAHAALLVEGRFAEAEVFVRALARLRPNDSIYVSNAHNDVAFGALRLIDPSLTAKDSLRRVEPLAIDLSRYKSAWHAAIRTRKAAA